MKSQRNFIFINYRRESLLIYYYGFNINNNNKSNKIIFRVIYFLIYNLFNGVEQLLIDKDIDRVSVIKF